MYRNRNQKQKRTKKDSPELVAENLKRKKKGLEKITEEHLKLKKQMPMLYREATRYFNKLDSSEM